jgi:hypothetical protein
MAETDPPELVCPVVPGVVFPTLPDPEAFGKLIGEKLDSAADAVSESFEDLQKKAAALEERIKNPPSATDMINEMSTQVSSAADKAATALEKAAIDAAAQVEENLVAEWDKAVKFARNSGTALADIYAGFKDAAECLKGAAGGAEEAFNKTAPELDAGVDDGRGQDGASAILAITESSDEFGRQTPVTQDDVDAARAENQEKNPKKPITATSPPVSGEPLSTDRNPQSHEEQLEAEGIPAPPKLLPIIRAAHWSTQLDKPPTRDEVIGWGETDPYWINAKYGTFGLMGYYNKSLFWGYYPSNEPPAGELFELHPRTGQPLVWSSDAKGLPRGPIKGKTAYAFTEHLVGPTYKGGKYLLAEKLLGS